MKYWKFFRNNLLTFIFVYGGYNIYMYLYIYIYINLHCLQNLFSLESPLNFWT